MLRTCILTDQHLSSRARQCPNVKHQVGHLRSCIDRGSGSSGVPYWMDGNGKGTRSRVVLDPSIYLQARSSFIRRFMTLHLYLVGRLEHGLRNRDQYLWQALITAHSCGYPWPIACPLRLSHVVLAMQHLA